MYLQMSAFYISVVMIFINLATLIDHLVDNTDSTSAWMFPGYPANYIHTIPFIIDKNKFNVRIRLVKGRQ